MASPQVGRSEWVGPGSQPVSRILCPPEAGGGHLSGPGVATRLVRPTWRLAGHLNAPAWPCSGRGSLATGVTTGAGALLPHPFTLTTHAPAGAPFGGLLSVGFSHASPRLGVTQRPALWSPDFPQRSCRSPRPPGRLPCFPRVPTGDDGGVTDPQRRPSLAPSVRAGRRRRIRARPRVVAVPAPARPGQGPRRRPASGPPPGRG